MSENDYKYLIQIQFSEKDQAKKLGFKWVQEEKKWGTNDIKSYRELKKLLDGNKKYLYVPFDYKQNVKDLGCKWCSEKKQWYTNKDNKNYQELIDTYHSKNFYHDSYGTHIQPHLTTLDQLNEQEQLRKKHHDLLLSKTTLDAENFDAWYSENFTGVLITQNSIDKI